MAERVAMTGEDRGERKGKKGKSQVEKEKRREEKERKVKFSQMSNELAITLRNSQTRNKSIERERE